MYHWMRTIIQLAASSKLDLTKYRDTIVKVATEHRNPIVQYHAELSQIIGQDAMRIIDSLLQIDGHGLATPTSDITTSVQSSFDLGKNMAVNWYTYLLQLLVLACADCSANPWEMASEMSKHHCSFQENGRENVIQHSMEIMRKTYIAIHTEVEKFKAELIQQCSTDSAERMLLGGLLPPLKTSMD